MNPVETFAAEITEITPLFQEEIKAISAYWHPSSPPPTEILGALGQELVRNWREITEEQKIRLADAIERGAIHSDEILATATLTGLVEASLNAAANSTECSEADIMKFLGPFARKYAESWLEFYGCYIEI
ncbi:hypothetical protein ACFQ4O_04260 [Methylopila musalis]|uniref:Uncharacterized protein n=1 Tax=Methylopila musalis TaxID=1134781 RepID=A0ABW3Z4V2_9HYPH